MNLTFGLALCCGAPDLPRGTRKPSCTAEPWLELCGEPGYRCGNHFWAFSKPKPILEGEHLAPAVLSEHWETWSRELITQEMFSVITAGDMSPGYTRIRVSTQDTLNSAKRIPIHPVIFQFSGPQSFTCLWCNLRTMRATHADLVALLSQTGWSQLEEQQEQVLGRAGLAEAAVTAGRVGCVPGSEGDGWDAPRVRRPAQIIRLAPTSPNEAGLDSSPILMFGFGGIPNSLRFS